MSATAPKNTRAEAHAREGEGVHVRRVYVPPGDRSTPLVFVEIEWRGLRVTFSVARLRGGAMEVRPPRLPDGKGEGLWMPLRERERLAEAVRAAALDDPAARGVVAPYG
jgi:hypothetical protein